MKNTRQKLQWHDRSPDWYPRRSHDWSLPLPAFLCNFFINCIHCLFYVILAFMQMSMTLPDTRDVFIPKLFMPLSFDHLLLFIPLGTRGPFHVGYFWNNCLFSLNRSGFTVVQVGTREKNSFFIIVPGLKPPFQSSQGSEIFGLQSRGILGHLSVWHDFTSARKVLTALFCQGNLDVVA